MDKLNISDIVEGLEEYMAHPTFMIDFELIKEAVNLLKDYEKMKGESDAEET